MVEAMLNGERSRVKHKAILKAIKEEAQPKSDVVFKRQKKHWMQLPENRAKMLKKVALMNKANKERFKNA